MAQKIVTTLIDDLDGTSLENGEGETVRFALDGTEYEIDLSEKNARELRDAFTRYVTNGRKLAKRPQAARGSKRSKGDLSAVRNWLRSQGHEVSDRGRIPNDLLTLYTQTVGK